MRWCAKIDKYLLWDHHYAALTINMIPSSLDCSVALVVEAAFHQIKRINRLQSRRISYLLSQHFLILIVSKDPISYEI